MLAIWFLIFSVGVLASENEPCNGFLCRTHQCVPEAQRCDGNVDCLDGSDEANCTSGSRCSVDDFQCKNGRCILKSWRCDGRNDCTDNSDEEDCQMTACAFDQVPCTNGECIAILWRCDGESDCTDGSDEENCHATRCDENHIRCNNGQCVRVSWVCDGSRDCFDGTDEKNCSAKTVICLHHEFMCETDKYCIDALYKCDGKNHCNDGSDEKDCPSGSPIDCPKGMFMCSDGSCIYDHQVCDGTNDCSNSEDEINCSQLACQIAEMLCPSSKRCIPRRWMCDGFADCPDGSDERDCGKHSEYHPRNETRVHTASECEEFYCYSTRQCLPWSKVCDGRQDCSDFPDEGGLCVRSCLSDNGGCSQICRKSPKGSHCSCFKGYRLLSDNKTCDDINECLEPGTCSHFCSNTKGGFKCSCASGYFLHHDQRHCKADGGPANMVCLLAGEKVIGIDLLSQKQIEYLNMIEADLRGIDYDSTEAVLYWTEWNTGTINSYSPDTHRQDIIVRLDSKPNFIKYDWIEKNLYYTDADSNIGVCTKDGRFCKTIVLYPTHLDSLDISPTTGQMFWTVWATFRDQISGVIERAEMDGSQITTIITQKILEPTSITVDHLLKMIFWTDVKLNTLECADFQGQKRREVIQYPIEYPFAMTIFEDHVYLSDWGQRKILKCKKFSDKDCTPIQDKSIMATVIMVIHKVMQPDGIHRCLNSYCDHMCLPTRSGYVCKCAEGFVMSNGVCLSNVTTQLPATPPTACPEHYCLGDFECVVDQGKYICKCPPQYTGNKCQITVKKPRPTYDYSWIVFILLGVLVIGVIIVIVLVCMDYWEKRQDRKEELIEEFENRLTCHSGRLLLETDDDDACDELVSERIPRLRKSLKNVMYTLASCEETDFPKNQKYSCQTQELTTKIMRIYRKSEKASEFISY